ncbi:MAG: hypothetical protein V3V00_11205 [Saprospiraceae bacterium]
MILYGGFLFTNTIEPVKKLHHSIYTILGEWVYNTWHPEIKADISTDVASIGADPNNDYILIAYKKTEVKSVNLNNKRNPQSPKQLKPIAYMSFKARMSHSIATFFLLSLIFATPNSWQRKLIGSIVAIYILYILVAMKLTFLMSMADGSKTSDDGLWYFFSNFIGNNESYQELYYILLLTIWLLVSISKQTVSKIIGNMPINKT